MILGCFLSYHKNLSVHFREEFCDIPLSYFINIKQTIIQWIRNFFWNFLLFLCFYAFCRFLPAYVSRLLSFLIRNYVALFYSSHLRLLIVNSFHFRAFFPLNSLDSLLNALFLWFFHFACCLCSLIFLKFSLLTTFLWALTWFLVDYFL